MYKEYSTLGTHIVIKRSPRAKRLALRLDNKNRVFNLVIPKRVSLRRAEDFARKNQAWIDEQLAALPARTPFVHNQIIPVFGVDKRIVIDFDDELKRTKITFIDGDILLVQTNQDEPAPRIMRFLKSHAKAEMGAMVHEKAARINKSVAAVSVRDTKSRWGSCSVDNKISLSWRLLFAPRAASDYVVAHEVAHLVHMNHSKDFWRVCADLSAAYTDGKTWMRNHGKTLMRYG